MAYITGMDVTEVSDSATFALGQKGISAELRQIGRAHV